MLQCARVGDQDGLGKLLREERYKRRVNRRDEHGMTALHYAARYNQLGVARILVEDAQAGKQRGIVTFQVTIMFGLDFKSFCGDHF